MEKDVVIDLIVANSCNKSCKYCCIKFNGRILERDNIDYLIAYLLKYKDSYNKCKINFFGGEPLLNYDNIVYFIKNNTNNQITYTLSTNGFFLDEVMIKFFKDNNVKIILSFHADDNNSYIDLLKKDFLKSYDNIEINFIVSPINISENYLKIKRAIDFGFKKINIIPVILTIKWSRNSLIELNTFIKYIDNNYINNVLLNNINISKYSFFDGIIQEKVFVIDYDLNIYQDSSDELYIGKQFPYLGNSFINDIEKKTFFGNLLLKDIPFINIINKHNLKDIFTLIYKIPKIMDYVKDYYLIYRIMNKSKQEEQRASYMIFGSNN